MLTRCLCSIGTSLSILDRYYGGFASSFHCAARLSALHIHPESDLRSEIPTTRGRRGMMGASDVSSINHCQRYL